MIPSKRKSESRRSSILKPRKPRQPLQNVNLDSSSNESSPTTSKIKRRVSFAEIKHVKEFCHSTEQGTVWDSTYEEHDSSLKRSFGLDQNIQVQSNLVGNQLLQNSVTKAAISINNENIASHDSNSKSANFIELPNVSQFEQATLLNKSCTSKHIPHFIVAYSDSDEESEELLNKKSQFQQSVITDTSCISKSKGLKNIVIYNDEYNLSNITDKSHCKSGSNNINCEVNKTCIQDFSMKLSEPLPVLLHSNCTKEQEKQKCNDTDNSDTNKCINNTICNDVSMEITEAVPIFTDSITSDLKFSKKNVTILPSCENPNTYNTDVNYANDSMALTCVIQPSVTDAEICCSNNMASNSLMEVTNVPYKIYEELTCNDNTRKDQIDKTEIFSNMQMDITKPLGTILSLNTYNKENLKIDETVFGDNNTMIFHDVSMEMTKAVLSKNEEFPETNICKSFNNTNTYKSSVSKDVCSEKNENIYTCFNQETASCKSIKLTEAVPAPLYHQRTLQAHDVQLTNKNIYKDYKNDRTEIFNNESMEITKSVNIHHSNINKSLKINETAPEYNKTILFHDGSVEMTAAVSSKNRYEITQPIACKSVPEEVTLREKSSNNSIFNEKTKLLCKSMEFTEVVPITLHDEKKSNITYTVQSFSQTLPKTTLLPVKESTRIIHAESVVNKTIQDTSMEITAAVPSTSQFMQDLKYAETVVNKTIQDTSMEITAAVPSTLQFMQDSKSNKTENLIISKNDEYQRATTNNTPTEANKSTTKKICTNARKDLEENIRHDELSNLVTRSSPDKLSHLSNTNFEKISSENKISNACEKRKRFKESQTFFRKIEFSPEKKKLFRRTDTDCDSENNEHFVKSVTEPTQISGLNLKDSLYESNEDNFLRTLSYFENDCEELNSIQPPSFVGLDSEEEISPQTFQQTTNTSINNILNCQTEEQKNIENTQIPIKIVEDYNESIKNISEDSLVINANNENSTTTQNINYYTTSIVKEIEETHINRVNKREHIRERIYKDLNLQNDNKEKEQYQNKLRQEPEKCSDRFENTAVAIENLTDNSKKCEKNLSEIKQNVEECTSIINDTKDENLTEEHLFSTLVQQLELHTRFVRKDSIWGIFYKNFDKKVIVFSFMTDSLLIPTYLTFDSNNSEKNLISNINIMSLIADDAEIEAQIAHKLFMEKINAEMLRELYKTHNDIFSMLNFLTQEVKLAVDFMFDLKRLDNVNLMEIYYNEILFTSWSKRMDIIIHVKIKVKPFDKITSDDISVDYSLGKNKIKERDVKSLIKHVKKDHKFLRRYIKDVKDYIDIMEETFTESD